MKFSTAHSEVEFVHSCLVHCEIEVVAPGVSDYAPPCDKVVHFYN